MADPQIGPPAEGQFLPVDASGASELVGYRSVVAAPGGEGGSCSLEVGPQHLNRLGVLHGGFVSMLLDNGCGVALREATGDMDVSAVTVTLSVNFIAGATAGQRVSAKGRVTGGGRSLKFLEAELRDETGRLLATGSAIFRMMRRR
ncbi:PaaI family thioesterase [uncultured Paracoccus sp.]|uniref:PaaI family thioesterase n=1 Tax=uncultured Paracoccus sp. TaxID=189685 RepID=UPI002592F3E1|nr:PaaI family thioesterase [uncultured Paracoccus sp.]